MNILVTGAKRFVGRNLVENLKNIRDGKNRTRDLAIGEIFEYDIDTDPSLLKEYCDKRDLNYDKFFKQGDTQRNHLTEFNSSNTELLNVEQVKEKLLSLQYIRDELENWGNKA